MIVLTAITIRHAGPRDIDGMLDLLRELFSIEADFCFDETKQRRGLQALLETENGRARAWVVENPAGVPEVIGMCTVQTVISTAAGGPAGILEDFVVKKEFRGQGIGARLMRHVEKDMKHQGILVLKLLADRNNTPALDFYKKIGWEGTDLICYRKQKL